MNAHTHTHTWTHNMYTNTVAIYSYTIINNNIILNCINKHLQLYYISSALGFYFPFDFCLHEDMNALISYALRFLPALIASFVLPSIILIK